LSINPVEVKVLPNRSKGRRWLFGSESGEQDRVSCIIGAGWE
jgi:hypothetical protein